MQNAESIKKSITLQIEVLNQRTLCGKYTSDRLEDCTDTEEIVKKLKQTRIIYWVSLALVVILGGMFFVAGFLQVFGNDFFNWSKAGLLLILTIGDGVQAWRANVDLERIKMIRYLVELKDEIKE